MTLAWEGHYQRICSLGWKIIGSYIPYSQYDDNQLQGADIRSLIQPPIYVCKLTRYTRPFIICCNITGPSYSIMYDM